MSFNINKIPLLCHGQTVEAALMALIIYSTFDSNRLSQYFSKTYMEVRVSKRAIFGR